jgi:hypothetical protein
LSELDLSGNPDLQVIVCSENQLTCLNVKNSNNSIIYYFNAFNNPLSCVEVDDVMFSNSNWTSSNFIFESLTTFSSNCSNGCSVLSDVKEGYLSEVTVFPNPTQGNLVIDLSEEYKAVSLIITNSLGVVVFSSNHFGTNKLNIELNVPNGVYYLKIESEGKMVVKKVVKSF